MDASTMEFYTCIGNLYIDLNLSIQNLIFSEQTHYI
jgi:hypothetical protein